MSNIKTVLGYKPKPENSGPASVQYLSALLVVSGDCSGEIFDIPIGDISIGRHIDNEIVLDGPQISRWHCCLHVSSDDVILKDLGSSNGTYLNENLIADKASLKPADLIRIGDIVLRYIPGDDAEREAIERLREEATIDGLTDCYSKDYFTKLLGQQLLLHCERELELALIIFDLDHFKEINDHNGHDTGDAMLRSLAEIIRSNGVREDDIFCRYGGDEFVVLLPRTGLALAKVIAERFQKAVAAHSFVHQDEQLNITISIGVAELAARADSSFDLFKAADNALYQAKSRGRNTVVVHQGSNTP